MPSRDNQIYIGQDTRRGLGAIFGNFYGLMLILFRMCGSADTESHGANSIGCILTLLEETHAEDWTFGQRSVTLWANSKHCVRRSRSRV